MAAGDRILIVEEMDALETAFRRILEARGYQCDGASSAAEAGEKLATAEYQLVLFEMSMRDGSSLELLSRIRALGLDLPVIAVSGWIDPATRRAISRGIVDFVVQPVRSTDLIAAVATALLDTG